MGTGQQKCSQCCQNAWHWLSIEARNALRDAGMPSLWTPILSRLPLRRAHSATVLKASRSHLNSEQEQQHVEDMLKLASCPSLRSEMSWTAATYLDKPFAFANQCVICVWSGQEAF